MFNRRSFFTVLGSGVAATAVLATGAVQASPLVDRIMGIEPTAAPVAAEPIEMRGRRRVHRHRHARRVLRRERRRTRRVLRRTRPVT